MREIKFRAWDTVMDFMVDVDYYKIDFKGQVFFDNDDKSLYNQTDKLILMQYTGLKDKNGIEIYEGDIVECGFKYRSYLPTFREKVSILSTNLTFPFARKWTIENKEYRDIIGSCEVIGNIYENPELLRED